MTSLLSCLSLCGDNTDQPQHNYSPLAAPSGGIMEKQPLRTQAPSFGQGTIPRRRHLNTSQSDPKDSDDHDHDGDGDDTDEIVNKILSILLTAPKSSPQDLRARLRGSTGVPHTTSWSSYLAEKILHALEETLSSSDQKDSWGEALAEAHSRAVALSQELFHELVEQVREHPAEVAATVLVSLLAVGVLAVLMPWVLELLGFAELGPIEGSFAAWFQRTYGGYVPKGSLFSFLQRLRMTWGK